MIESIERQNLYPIIRRLHTHYSTGKANPNTTILGTQDKIGPLPLLELSWSNMGNIIGRRIYFLNTVGTTEQGQCISFTVGNHLVDEHTRQTIVYGIGSFGYIWVCRGMQQFMFVHDKNTAQTSSYP